MCIYIRSETIYFCDGLQLTTLKKVVGYTKLKKHKLTSSILRGAYVNV